MRGCVVVGVVLVLVMLAGTACTRPPRDLTWRPMNDQPLEVPPALRRADNDFSPTGELDGAREAIPPSVQALLRSAAGTRATNLGPAYVIALPDRDLYAVRCDGPKRAEYLLIVRDLATDRVSPEVARVSVRRSPADPKFPAMPPPFLRAEDLDRDGAMELLIQGTWAGGTETTSVVTRVFRLEDDLRLVRVADFLTGDHFVWARNPTGVWIVGHLHAGKAGPQIDYGCHPLGRPAELHPIGEVAFRYSASEGGYVEAGAHIRNVTFSDFLRLDARGRSQATMRP